MSENIVFGSRILVLVFITVLVVLFLTFFWYRIKHPSLQVEMHTKRCIPPGIDQSMDMHRIQELMTSVNEHPKDVSTLLKLTNLFISMGAWDRAVIFIEMAEKVASKDPRVLRSKGRVYFEKKEFDKAAAVFAKILMHEPQDLITRYNLGITLKYYLNRNTEAYAHFKAVTENTAVDEELHQEAAKEIEHNK